jgi:hypothetical protein
MISAKEYKERRERVLDEKKNVTSKISDTCRFIGFGLLIVYYTIQSADGAFATHLKTHSPVLVYAVGIAGAATILLDYLQYLFGAMAVDRALKRPTMDYDETSCAYKARLWAYRAKQFATAVGAAALIILVVFS